MKFKCVLSMWRYFFADTGTSSRATSASNEYLSTFCAASEVCLLAERQAGFYVKQAAFSVSVNVVGKMRACHSLAKLIAADAHYVRRLTKSCP